MNLTEYKHHEPVLVAGEALAATHHFMLGKDGCDEITATPLGVVVRRNRAAALLNPPHVIQLSDLILRDGGGWGILEKKPAVPSGLQQKTKEGQQRR